mmetsp:Transcript_28773/g.47174  ORF Transcript_28773/g.47174 Transcript_28773/m.47174 type:complete len:306 (+) Transcript_28773:56-973(+)|eukprot:CAMPEP_0202714056 /NCGR_PEP_ID=MMETSP1385-20130828/62296_1 /ASSEMBLY_ACC=CAM_ASM_000861 /TAXON_ID=933848 /ORGANISM="Elphidium margaritaceum" /LENGTH=305 /DNA_ID=CAMNT_0049374623 /DNA_START=52 /DNA_END=969 /DNA_ORIENTATION=-
MVRIKYTYTTKYRLTFWACALTGIYVYGFGNYHVDRAWRRNMGEKLYWVFDLNYEEWKRRERWRWSEYLRNWDPIVTGNTGRGNMGNLSASFLDKWIYGNRKFQDPPSYEYEANQFIALCDKSGLDPAKPLMNSIKKMVDHYYPWDLDDNPEETAEVKAPHVQWIYQSDFDEIVEEEEKKPKQNTLARYLWFVPGYRDYYDDLKNDARNQEESFLLSSGVRQRTVFYEETDRLAQRWALELNDYAPLLAGRVEKKYKLAKYLMDKENQKDILEALKKPGGVKQIFINAEIIKPLPTRQDEIESIH